MKHLLIQIDAATGILRITINRVRSLNALNTEVVAELQQAFDSHRQNEAIKGVILTGSGEKAFVAGADIKEFTQLSHQQAMQMAQNGHNLMNTIEQYPKPVVAAINGYALGGGCELAMACHIRIAASHAQFGLPEVKLGLIPGYGGTQRLTQLVGKSKALELIMTADMISADEAHRLGLANHVVPQEDLLTKCQSIIKKIGKRGPIAITNAIKAVNAHFAENIDGFQAEIEQFGACFTTEDVKEGVQAFIEKRKARFMGK